MKKLLTIATVLLTAALVFTGCSNPAASSGDGGEKLPGTWVSSVTYLDDWSQNNWTASKNQISYNFANPASLNIPKKSSTTYAANITPTQLYGVKAIIKQESESGADIGLVLFQTSGSNGNWDTYYELRFWQNSYILYEKLSGEEPTCLSRTEDGYTNTSHNAIKKEGNENEVLFYTDGDYLVIKVNGTEIKRIEKKLDSGKTQASITIYDAENTPGPINASWKFVEFQTAK